VRAFVLVAVVAIAGCNSRHQSLEPIVIQIDTRTDAFSAKTACNWIANQAQNKKAFSPPCNDQDTVIYSQTVEREFRSSAMANRLCRGIRIEDMKHDGSENDRPNTFNLLFTFDLNEDLSLNLKETNWNLDGPNKMTASGDIEIMRTTSDDICRIVKTQGAIVGEK
jgi:hypothetical protein